jgi:cobalt-zinc-cadmium efflux system membrane fusion protein
MNLPQTNTTPRRWLVVLGVAVLVTGCVAAVAVYGFPRVFGRENQTATTPPRSSARTALPIELVEGKPDTVFVPEPVRQGLRVGPSQMVRRPSRRRSVTLPGTTALDPARLYRVKTRFNAEVIEIGQVRDPQRSPGDESTFRELTTGDEVKKGTPLAVVWSIDVGGKKSDLLDALLQLRLDEVRLKARIELWKNGNLPEDVLNQTRRDVVGDQSAADRAERTLRTWNIPENEIQATKDEAEQAYQRQGKRDKEKERLWARSELVAPRDGTIVERNVSIGEYVADNTINLFTIADVDVLLVQANAPEEQLPELLALQRERSRWTLRTVGAAAPVARFKLTDKSLTALSATDVPRAVVGKLEPLQGKEYETRDEFSRAVATVLDIGERDEFGDLIFDYADTSAIQGTIDDVGYILDPNQHTAVVKGRIPNPGRRLRAGQFVSATIYLPAPANVVEVPLTALAEDGKQSFVFVQPDSQRHEYTMRRVRVTHRFEKTAFVRSQLEPGEDRLSPEEIAQGFQQVQSLSPQDRILTTGVLELRAALEDLLSKAKKKSEGREAKGN